MEMEMDKFLAKKQPVMQSLLPFQNSPHDLKASILQSVIHMCLKSLYENLRLHSFNLYGYQQVQTDVYFLFTVITQLIPYEEAQAK